MGKSDKIGLRWEKLTKVDKDFGDTLIEVRYCTKCSVCGDEGEGSAVRARWKFFGKDR